MPASFTSASCPTCQTHFERVPLDECGPDLDLSACHHPGCGAFLCANCEQFQSDCCGHTFCSDHMTLIPDGTPRGLRCCPTCALECEELPAAIPPQRERGLPARVEVA